MHVPTASQIDVDTALAQASAKIEGLGRALSSDLLRASQQIYAEFHPAEPYAGVRVMRDVRYGPDPRNRLDLFTREDAPGDCPVLLYIHGGGFQRGDKKVEGLPYFDNIGLWAARRGWVGVSMTYRLAPAHRWPAGTQDIAQAMAWLCANIAGHGGDPERIFLMGHSAGAVHAADFLGTGETAGIAGAMLFSGLYDFARVAHGDSLALYFGPDYAARSPLPALLQSSIPVLVGVAEFDPSDFQRQALLLTTALFERDDCLPRFVCVNGQNHYTEMFQIGLGTAESLCADIGRFVETGR